METVLIGLLILFTIIFCLSFIVGILSVRFDWNIDEECFGMTLIALVIMFGLGIIGAILYGGNQYPMN